MLGFWRRDGDALGPASGDKPYTFKEPRLRGAKNVPSKSFWGDIGQ